MQKAALSLASCIAVLAAAPAVCAGSRRIAVLQADPELRRAIALSLQPWGVETIQSEAALPASSLPQAVLQVVKLARKLGVDAVVWVSSSSERSVLWVYDTRTEKVTTRVLADTPPFESSRAAAIALSVKTVLRASEVAPAAERFGAAPTPALRDSDRLALESHADARFLARGKVEPRLGLAGVVWLTRGPWLGATLNFSLGPGVSVNARSYQGHYREYQLGSALRLRFLNARLLAAAAFVGVAGHAAALDGSLSKDSANVQVHRLNASVGAGGTFDLKLGAGAYLGVNVQASYLIAYQRYLVEGAPVFTLWPVATSLGGHCGVELF